MSRALLSVLFLVLAGCATDAPSASQADGLQGPTDEQAEQSVAEPEPTPRARTAPPTTAPPSEAPSVPDEAPTIDVGTEPACAEPPCYGGPVRIGRFDPEALPEASGLAVSRQDPSVLYLLEDGGGTPTVWAVRRDGGMIGAIEVAGVDARDTESLALGPCVAGDDRSCLYLGDIGDNGRGREDIAVVRVEEPDLSGGGPTEPVAGESIRLRYPDGAHDAEALLVGPDGALVIVTKAPFDRETQVTGTTHVYRAAGFADGTLEHLGELALPEPAQSFHAQLVGNVVTGGEAVDGHVVLRTYDQVLSLRGDDLATLPSWELRTVPPPFELQSEAIALDADGCSVLTAGERVGDIWHVACLD